MKTRLAFIIIIPLVSLSLALLAGSGLAWRIFVLSLLVIVLSWLWARLSLRSVTGSASVPVCTCRTGEVIKGAFSVENSGRLPMPVVEVDDLTVMPGYRSDRSFSLPSRSSYHWQAVIPCNHRGSYATGGLEITVSDPLGLFPARRRFGESREIIVYPATLELTFFQVVPRQQPSHSPRRWFASEAGAGASRVHEYTSGDSLRHVHWPSTAHSGRLMVKEFDAERANYAYRSIRIIADMHQDVHHGRGSDTTVEAAVTVMASLVKKYLDGGKEVGLAAAGDRLYRYKPDHTLEHEERLFHSLAVMKAQGQTPFARLLADESEMFEPGSAVIVIMPAEGQDIVPVLRRAVARGVLATVILLDSSTYDGWTFAYPFVRSIASRGLNVYVIRRGEDIAAALDSRLLFDRTFASGVTAG